MQRTQQALPKACSNSHLISHEQGLTTVEDAWPCGRRTLEGVLLKKSSPSISSVLRRWDRWLKQQKELLRAGHHLTHAEFVLLSSNAGGRKTNRRRQTRDIAAVGQLHDGVGELAPKALFCSRLLQNSMSGGHSTTGRLLKGNGPLPRLRRCLHSGARNHTPQQQYEKRSGHNLMRFPSHEGSGVNWSARPRTTPILGLGSA